MLTPETALILAPHTDDGEFGCGGTISWLIERGSSVYYVAFSICEESIPVEFPRDILATEVQVATQKLGIPLNNLIVHRYPVRRFTEHRQEILEDLVKIRDLLNPDLVFLPSQVDIHQDHQVISNEGIRAFKFCTILGYEMPWNNLQFPSTALIPLHQHHIRQKIEAIEAYQSQGFRNYKQPTFIEGLARVRGQQAGVDFAEAFQVIRWIIR